MRRILSASTALLASAVLIGTACAFAGEHLGWPFDLGVHFWPHLLGAAALLIPMAMMGMAGTVRSAVLAFAFVVVVTGVQATSASMPVPPDVVTGGREQRIIVAAANVWGRHSQSRDILNWLAREDPDLVVLSEMNDDVAARLADLRTRLPHARLRNMGDIAIASRWPWDEVSLPDRPPGQIAVARVATPIGPLLLVGTHPVLPTTPDLAARRDRLIRFIATLASESAFPVIVAGDFNATPWSRPMRKLTAVGLRYGPGAWDSTWPVYLPRPFGVAIDHVLAGNGCRVVERRHGVRIGSDHWPIIAVASCRASRRDGR